MARANNGGGHPEQRANPLYHRGRHELRDSRVHSYRLKDRRLGNFLTSQTLLASPCNMSNRAASAERSENMSSNDRGTVAETVFERNQRREREIGDALRLEEERHAAVIKNMHRLRALRLSRKQSRPATDSAK